MNEDRGVGAGDHQRAPGRAIERRRRPQDALAWLASGPSLEDLCSAYPQEWLAVQQRVSDLRHRGEDLHQVVRRAQAPGAEARGRARPLPVRVSEEVRRQMLLHAVRRAALVASTGVQSGSVRFNLLDGWVLQRLLFRQGLERKPVRLTAFKLLWPLVRQRRFLMPLVRPQGIYCFYSRSLVAALADLIGDRTCVEIAAGDGTLSRFLRQAGVDVVATDDLSWASVIDYPPDVVKESARSSLQKRAPQVVLCSWPPTDNDFERLVFNTPSVRLYVVLSSTDEVNAGDWSAYRRQTDFDMTTDVRLSRLLLPPETSPAVHLFRRRVDGSP